MCCSSTSIGPRTWRGRRTCGGDAHGLDRRQEGGGQDVAGSGARGRAGASGQAARDDDQARHARGRRGSTRQGHVAALPRGQGGARRDGSAGPAADLGAARAGVRPDLPGAALPRRRRPGPGGGIRRPAAPEDRDLPARLRPGPAVRPGAPRRGALGGYAVRSADVAGASSERPVALRVIETVPAGRFPERALGPGEATRIFTGAPLPAGTDGVIRQEDTDPLPDGRVAVRNDRDNGRNVRRRGEDIRAGALVLARGAALGPAQLGVLASIAYGTPLVHRPPRVAFMGTGDE